jgi:hypothetical protein
MNARRLFAALTATFLLAGTVAVADNNRDKENNNLKKKKL